jgi:glutamate-1-semialdehyde 2,1-aminomutase
MSRYSKSERHLERAERTIPLGSQTFSKSRTQYPVGISPLYIDRAKGCNIWDLDGYKYIDLVSSLASVTLGYGDKRICQAVRSQLRKGVSFSLPGILEAEVAEMICEMVPSAEMVRFGKNGTDATSAAVRLARAYTGRDHIAVCGYHGWQDWYIGSTTRNKGVPKSVSDLTHTFEFNNLESLKKLILTTPPLACLIMEPMTTEFPNPGFLEEIRAITEQNGIVLIFDETITGFRFSSGGAQELFGVIPDLSTFGKALANGFPLSAVVGKRDIMIEMEEIFFSGTFGGELLSLAAARETLNRHRTENVSGTLSNIGASLHNEVEILLAELNISDVLKFSGHPTWKFLNWSPRDGYTTDEIKTFFSQHMYENGVLILSSHNVSLSHHASDVKKIIKVYEKCLIDLHNALKMQNLRERLRVQPLKPLFRVR